MKTTAIVSLLALAGLLAGCRTETRVTTVEGERGRLTLTKPGDVTVSRGEVAEITISIERENMSGPVQVQFDNLPSGVVVVEEEKRIENDRATFHLRAENDANLVENHTSRVTVQGPDEAATTAEFQITVRQRDES